MERRLRTRHARTWLLLGPALLVAVVLMILNTRFEAAPTVANPAGESAGVTP